jgi:hypothetical protein
MVLTSSPAGVIRRLLDGVVSMGGIEADRAEASAWAVLGSEGWDDIAGPTRSGINHDGLPLQLVLTSDREGLGFKLLGDPCCGVPDIVSRYRGSLESMERVLEMTGSRSLGALFRRTLEFHLPPQQEQLTQYPDGVMWLGTALRGPGCAIYMDARRGGHEAALARLGGWFRDLCGDTEDIDCLMAALASRTRLMSLGIEGVSFSNARAKIYWRLSEAQELQSLGIPGFCDPAFAEFLSLCVGNRTIRLTGVVLNAGIDVATGRWADVKVDICGCRNCLNYSREETVEAIGAIVSHFGLVQPPVARVLNFGEFAFCGVGIDSEGQCRLNVYIKPANNPTQF